MSTILGIFGGDSVPHAELVRRMLAGPAETGELHTNVWHEPGALLAVARPAWQMAPGFCDGELIVRDGAFAVVADAAIYYRHELAGALRRAGVEPAGAGPAALILAAYRLWGEKCVDHLEGDYAFILWDSRERGVFCARDFGGKRSLHYAEIDGIIVVATSLAGVLAHPGCPSDWNLASIAETAAGLQAASNETCYRAVKRLHAGYTLRWGGQPSTVTRFWNPRPRADNEGLPFAEAAVRLRELIADAVEQRTSRVGPTSMQLSGGWDSPTIFAVAHELSRRRGESPDLMPVSISYPPGDPGREDEIIDMITSHWSASTHWLEIAQIPLLDRPEENAARRDEPFVHVYEHWNRRLVQAGRELGTRVMFDGFGGDSLFQCSPSFFADLLRSGRILELRREWRSKGMKDGETWFRWAVLPLFPLPLAHFLSGLPGGRHFHPYLARKLPSWIDPRFARKHDLQGRERRGTPRPAGGTQNERELFWHLTNPWVTRMLAQNYAFGLDTGVETRSPIFDRRVVEFAITRPRNERSHRKQTKRLLRASVAGLLPDDVLAPRLYRTGMTTGFFQRAMQTALPAFRDRLLNDPILAQLGIVDPAPLQIAFETFMRGADVGTGVQLYFTLQTELWLQARMPARTPPVVTQRTTAPLTVG